MSFSLTLSPEYLVRSTDYEAPHYVLCIIYFNVYISRYQTRRQNALDPVAAGVLKGSFSKQNVLFLLFLLLFCCHRHIPLDIEMSLSHAISAVFTAFML